MVHDKLEHMMNILKTILAGLAVAASAVFPLASSAQSLAVTAPYRVNVHAGPDGVYPIVAVLAPRMEIDVYGCLEGYSWCDVGFGIDRGWIHSSNLRYYYQNRYVPFAGVATIVGIGLTGFFFDDYWRSYYRERPFYSDRDRWYRRPPPRYWYHGRERDYDRDHRAGRFNNREHNQGFVPHRGQPQQHNFTQPAQPIQIAPNRPNGGQPGLHSPQPPGAGVQQVPQIGVQPQHRGGMQPQYQQPQPLQQQGQQFQQPRVQQPQVQQQQQQHQQQPRGRGEGRNERKHDERGDKP